MGVVMGGYRDQWAQGCVVVAVNGRREGMDCIFARR